MPLPTLIHNLLPTIPLAGASIEDILIAISNATYAGWTAYKFDDGGTIKAVELRPNLADIQDVAIVISGSASSETPKMAVSSWQPNVIHVGMAKGVPPATHLVDWEAVEPFGAGVGVWDGFIAASRSILVDVFTKIRILESAETITIAFTNNSGAVSGMLEGGCRFRHPSEVYEANGRLVGVWGTGYLSVVDFATWAGTPATTGKIFGNGSPGYQQCRIFRPGLTSVMSPSRMGAAVLPTSTNLFDHAGGIVLPEIVMVGENIALACRDVWMGPLAKHGGNVSFDGVLSIYLFGANESSDSATAAFRAV